VKAHLGIVRKYIPVMEAKLHRSLGIAVCLSYPKRYTKSGDDYASTEVFDPLGQTVGPTVSTCWMEINGATFTKLANKNNTLAHELFHCFQGGDRRHQLL
jgi:hypothetical protein